MTLVLELAIIAIIAVLAISVLRNVLAGIEDDAFDAELTAIANERARSLGTVAIQEMN